MARMRMGLNLELERQADEILRVGMKGITKHSEKKDVLTPNKWRHRRGHEVHVSDGTPDPTLVRRRRSGGLSNRTGGMKSFTENYHGPSSTDYA